MTTVDLRVRCPVDDEELSRLHALAFGTAATAAGSWAQRLASHSLTWVGAFAGDGLIGYLNVCSDGGAHAVLLDAAVHPDHQRRGIGTALVRAAAREAARADCTWLHVDYEPHLESFYRDACGFQVTDAALLHLVDLASQR